MKVEFTDEMKRHICIADAPKVKRLIREMDGDEEASYYAKSAANLVVIMKHSGGNAEIIQANAKISLNCRIKDRYFEGSGNLDVWIEFTAQYWNAFCVGGAYLSDIWDISGDDEKNADIYRNMFVRWFKEEK